MAKAKITETFDCTCEEFFKIISDYESYPVFLPEVKQVRVVKKSKNKKLVEFSISVIKSATYQLWMKEEGPYKITWFLDSGDLFKVSSGSWILEDKKTKTKATYSVDIEFKGFMPSAIAKGLVSLNLPNMMSSYKERVKTLKGK